MDDDYVSLSFETNKHETFVNARNASLVPLLWQQDESVAVPRGVRGASAGGTKQVASARAEWYIMK